MPALSLPARRLAAHPVRRLVVRLAILAAALPLAGCYTVNSFVDAPDADPGDGICARALTPGELAAGLQAPTLTPGLVQTGRQALAGLSSDEQKALARGDVATLERRQHGSTRALARSALANPQPAVVGGGAQPGRPGGFGIPRAGLCTLRAAIMEANAQPWKSVITVPPGTYDMTLAHAPGGAGGSLLITRNVRLQGSDAATTIINAMHTRTIVLVDGAAAGDVEINHLTLRGANVSGDGGGLWVHRGAVEMEDAVVDDNFAFSAGGGIVIGANGELVLRRTTVSNNDSAQAGGIINHGELWIYDSTIEGNSSTRAGGIMNGGNMRLRNVTVSGNYRRPDTSAAVGGIYQGGFAILDNVTITDNEGYGSSSGSFQGGGIQIGNGATTVVRNSIIAGNDGVNGPNDCVGSLSGDSQYNLIGDSGGCTIPSHLNTFVLDVEAELGPLALHGGPTRSHMPGSTSPARDAGYAFPPPAINACQPRDQRGVPRPQGAGHCDMGAVEYTPNSSAVTGFMLVDAATNTDIRPLRNDDWLVLAQLPPQLAIRAVVSPLPSSVVFDFDGTPAYRIENAAPYSLGGDAAGDYAPVPLAGGEHVLTATPFAAAGGAGAAGPSRTIRFNVLQVN